MVYVQEQDYFVAFVYIQCCDKILPAGSYAELATRVDVSKVCQGTMICIVELLLS